MLSLLQSQLLFYIALTLVTFVPGYFLLLAIFGRSRSLSTLERFVIIFGLSIVSVDFILFAYSKAGLAITRLSTLAGIALFSLVTFVIYKRKKNNNEDVAADDQLFNFSRKQFLLTLLLIFLTVFIKTAYLSRTELPTSTDMGHHMYWSKWLVVNHALPTYDGMPDFIIGEHTIFGTMALIGNLDFLSAFPPLVLLLMDLMGILAVFMLTLRIFKNKTIAILTLLFLGVLFAVTSPQAKFVSGGVVGNIMGNFLLPLAFYFYYRAFSFLEEKREFNWEDQKFFGVAIFVTFGLFYTHHLTGFIFLFVFALLAVLFGVINRREIKDMLTKVFKMFFSPPVFSVFVLGLIFFFFVFTPNYIKTSAVDTAVGAPSKNTREGLTLSTLGNSVGEARLALGFVGLLFLAWAYKKRNFGYALIAAWAVMIFIMSSLPQLLLINLPSSRIGNYLSYPLAILSAYGFWAIFHALPESRQRSKTLLQASFLLILIFILVGGISDSTQSLSNSDDAQKMEQTFNSSQYLAARTSSADIILKDHNYIDADSWMKLFFMRGYKYPDSRGYFKRYDDPTKPREMCTLYMISNPGGADAQQCFADSGTDFLMVNPQYDAGQFHKLAEFNQVYASDNVAVYYKNK